MSLITPMQTSGRNRHLGNFTKPLMVFGGPYSNLQALDALFAEAARRNIAFDHMLCTGDVVAYCGSPEATTRRMIEADIATVKGNCEASFGDAQPDCGCGFEPGSACDLLSKSWFEFANGELSVASRVWMKDCPDTLTLTMNGKSLRLFHGGLTDIASFIFASDPMATKWREMHLCSEDILIGGHCGLPFAENIADRLWLNAGVIGMPANDGTPRVWYSLLTPADEGIQIEIVALNYDYTTAANTMRLHGLPNGYADALETGLWPSLDILPEIEAKATGQALTPAHLHFSNLGARAVGA